MERPKKKPIRLKGAAYTKFRKQVHDRAKGVCEVCGMAAPLVGFNCGTVSHIKSRGSGGGDTLDNVRWEHWDMCHSKKHGPRWSKKKILNLASPGK